jgi:hypothetical protein
MKYLASIVTVGAVVWLAGCSSAPIFTVIQPVGPAPADQAKLLHNGFLQVYSARQPLYANETDWQWDCNSFDYALAHTDYLILTQDGKTLLHVRNALNPADPMPTRVTLPPGRYQVEAQAGRHRVTGLNLRIPVVIEPGKITVVHLSGKWEPRGHFTNADVVRLPDGRIVGWLAAH